MFKQFLDYLKAPFGFVRLNIDHLKRRLVVDRVSRKVAEVANTIDRYAQFVRKRLCWVCLLYTSDAADE